MKRRWIISAVFIVLGLIAFRLAQGWAANEREPYQQALGFLRQLSNRGGEYFAEPEQRLMQAGVMRLQQALSYWDQGSDRVLQMAKRDGGMVISTMARELDRNASVLRLRQGAEWRASRRAVLGSGIVLLRIEQPDMAPSELPSFHVLPIDAAQTSKAMLNIGSAQVTYALLAFDNAPEGQKKISVHLRSDGAEWNSGELTIDTPRFGTLSLRIVDDTARPTAVAAGIFATNGEIAGAPANAIPFDDGGFVYQPGHIRNHAQTRYWPGKGREQRAFFVEEPFTLRVPAGEYKVLASKGPEFIPINETLTVEAGETVTRELTIRRWIDMPARGWYSGDGHVHYARESSNANKRLLTWTRAEDVHVANVLRMGDAKETYFEQKAFGKTGRVREGDYVLVAGQEDPRTNILGHTLHMNLREAVRFPDRYYHYDAVFDAVHAQGGLSGYAHVYQSAGQAFWVRRDMALSIPEGKVDFAEISEFGDLGLDLYYQYLNLGFPLTATAGSDVPWGDSIGTSRMYAYTGEKLDVDAWFDAVKRGHTFVTTGPLVEFTVNGKIAGETIKARAGDVLHVKATASGRPVEPRYLEVVSQGTVVKSAQGASAETLAVEFNLPVTESTWIAARCAGAHTSPVYVEVDGKRFWKRSQVKNLVAQRMKELDEVEQIAGTSIPPQGRGNWDSPEVFQKSAQHLRQRVRSMRERYNSLLREAEGN